MNWILRRTGPVYRFALVALVFVVALGWVLVTLLTGSINDANLNSAEAEARDTVARRLVHELTPADMTTPMEGDRLAAFDRFVKESVVSARTARVKVWGANGQVIYADDRDLLGKDFPSDEEYLEALQGETTSDLSTGDKAESGGDPSLGRLLEVYTPVIFPGSARPAGVFEIYQVYAPVASQVAVMRTYVIATLGGGLALFYVALLSLAAGLHALRGKSHALAASQRRFEELVHSVDAIVWEAEPARRRFTFVSGQAEPMLGYPRRDWIEQEDFLASHIHPDDWARVDRECAFAAAEGRPVCIEYRVEAADGRTLWVRDLVRADAPTQDRPRLRGVMFDITERKNAELTVSRLAAIVQSSDDIVIGVDPRGNVVTWNGAAERLTGLPASSVMGRLLAEVIPDQRKLVERVLARIQRGEHISPFEVDATIGDGKRMSLSVSIFTISSEEGSRVGVGTIIRDVTSRKHMEQQLVYLAGHDALTGLLNRRRFEGELERELAVARRDGVPGALVFIDLDRFKGVNDSFGHRAGDELLVNLARVLKRYARDTDLLARLGGDEFAVFLNRTTSTEAVLVAQRLCDEIGRHHMVLGCQQVGVTASIGIALLPDHGAQVSDLLVHGDAAMYRAKALGRGEVHVYDPARDDQGELSQLRWEQRIQRALSEDGFVLYAQPVRSLSNGVAQYEILLRMKGEGSEVILPGAFLPAAERSGLIHAIDRWVVTQSIRLVGARQGRRATPRFSVNISGLAFRDETLLPLIERELQEAQIDPGALILEITETAAIADMSQAKAFIKRLKALGCRFAIDDFGAGASSFYYLKSLQVDYLKIDGSFIENLANSAVDQHLVKAMVEVARGLGNQTIAEFVGDERTMQLLAEYGVDMVQGYYIGRPGPVSDLPASELAAA